MYHIIIEENELELIGQCLINERVKLYTELSGWLSSSQLTEADFQYIISSVEQMLHISLLYNKLNNVEEGVKNEENGPDCV